MKIQLLLALALMLCGCLCAPQPADTAASTSTVTVPKAPLKAASNRTAEEVLTNVGEALFMWKPYSCSYVNQLNLAEKTRTEVVMDHGKYHALITASRNERVNVVNDGVYVYVWYEEKPLPGTKYRISEITGLREHIESSDVVANRSVAIPTEYMDLLTAKNVTCRPSVVPDDAFVPPKNKVFEPGRGAYDYGYDSKLDKFAKNTT